MRTSKGADHRARRLAAARTVLEKVGCGLRPMAEEPNG
jgi:hypothetical protein